MSKQKPSTPKGTRDFSPEVMLRRNYIFGVIEEVFQRYGFLPLETPAMENLSTLTGKYGEEGDRLIFKVLNSGNAWSKVDEGVKRALSSGEEVHPGKLAAQLSEKALRYDLTVPFARFVVQHQNDLHFPFKRYQIQPVWRADRPQKGRYREFYQCDADMIGSKSLLNELDLISIFDDVFSALDLKVNVLINDRKVLTGLAEVSGQSEKVVDMVTALDKLDKIGREKVEQEMRDRGISDSAIASLAPLFELSGDSGQLLEGMEQVISTSETGMQGLSDIRWMMERSRDLGLTHAELAFDPTLARGLDYYTGAIFEVKASEGSLQSSICGGGRYDDLTGIFGLPDMSGVGISFGADRIYDVLTELSRFPNAVGQGTTILFTNFGEEEAKESLKQVNRLRKVGVSAELYPDKAKMKKQFKYADAKNVRFVATIGTQELEQGLINVKDMESGEQLSMSAEDLMNSLIS